MLVYCPRTSNLCRRVTHPDVEATFDQHKRQAALGIGKTDPDLAVHEKAVVHVNDLLLQAVRATVDPQVLLALAPGEAVNAKQVAILGRDDMLLGIVSKLGAQIHKV
jgi:hypothetical protein